LRLDHAERVALWGIAVATELAVLAALTLRTVVLIAALAIVALIARALAITLVAIFAGPVVPRPIIPRPIVTGPVIPGAVISLTILALLAIVPRAVIVALLPIIARPVVALTIVSWAVVSLAIFALLLRAFITLPVVALLPLAVAAGLGLAVSFRLDGLVAVLALVLKVDVVARDELVATHDLRHGALGLHGAQDPEVMLGVLQIVLRQHPIPRRASITRQLRVLLEDMLGRAADLDVVRAIGVERPIGVVLGFPATTAATAPAAASTAVALTLHPFEISHILADLLRITRRARREAMGGPVVSIE
jgi:hypothetical protein